MDENRNGTKEIGSIEVYFAKKLANNDTKIRDRAVKRMKIWLSSRNGDSFSELEMMKLWKGLFYCMWFSDKPLVQEELAKSLASLIYVLKDSVAVRKFIDGFFQTMGREWHGIDALRLDKFYMLNRKFLHNIFQYLKHENWSSDALDCVSGSLSNGPCSYGNEKYAKGVKMFINEIFLEEFAKVCQDETPDKDVVSGIIDPLISLCAQTEDYLIFKGIEENVLEKLLPGNDNKIEGLSVNCLKIADRIFEEAGKKSVSTKRRKILFKYSNEFREASKLEETTETVDDGNEVTGKIAIKSKSKKSKAKSSEKSKKSSKKRSKNEKSKDDSDNTCNVANEEEEISSSITPSSNIEKQISVSSDPLAVKLNFESSFALDNEKVKVNKNKKKGSKKLNKLVEQNNACLMESSSVIEEGDIEQRKRKSENSLSIEVGSKFPKEDIQDNSLEKTKPSDISVTDDAKFSENAIVENMNIVTEVEPRSKPAEAKKSATGQAARNAVDEVTKDSEIKMAETVAPIETEQKSVSSPKVLEEKIPSSKKSQRRKSLARKAKKRRSSREGIPASPLQDQTLASPASLPLDTSIDKIDNSPAAMQTRRKSLARKAKKPKEVDSMSSIKKKVIFELSKNAVTSISNLKISPAAVFTPDQKPKKGVLKESSGKRRRASDFF